MALRPLLLSAVVGIASLGLFHSPSADAQGYVSISVGTPQHHRPYYGGGYDNRYYDRYGARRIDLDRYGAPRIPGAFQRSAYNDRSVYTLVPGHWVRTAHGRHWMPAQYVRVQPHGYRGNYGYSGYGGQRVIHRPVRHSDPRYAYPPRRGW